MPYITEAVKEELKTRPPATAGELNYVITQVCRSYLKRAGTSYGTLNELVGVLECAKLEFYRREVSPYENLKIKANGDVYDTDPDQNFLRVEL